MISDCKKAEDDNETWKTFRSECAYLTRVSTGIGGIRLLALANRNLVLQVPPPASYFVHYAFRSLEC